MPLFALANAGVSLEGVDLSAGGHLVMLGVGLALVAGKPLGVVGATWLVVRLGWCRLAPGVSWGGICLIGLLAGIGFTMSIFIAMLAFSDERLLGSAKLGVLLGSLVAATLGLGWGARYVRRERRKTGAASIVVVSSRLADAAQSSNARWARQKQSSGPVEQRTRQHRPVEGPSFSNSAVLHTTFRSTLRPATIGPWPSILPSG